MPQTITIDATASAPRFTALPPLALYVHLPWCLKKCPYCDFNSHEQRNGVPEQAYLDALCADLEAALPFIWGRRIHSIFIGGGTPSLFAPASIDRLIADLRARLPQELAAQPSHLSIYHLTVEPNTYFAKHPPPLPDDDLAFDMLDRLVERTATAGLQRYEVSAFARHGHRCAHNLNYWQFGDYLGI